MDADRRESPKVSITIPKNEFAWLEKEAYKYSGSARNRSERIAWCIRVARKMSCDD